jgi:uncharacterized protein (TIGR02284 family)
MAHEQTIKILEELVETCRDGQEGYRDAADHVTDSNLRHFFNEQSLSRAGFAGELEQELIAAGKHDPNRSGSASAAMHRAWIDLKSALGGGDHAILTSVESGEDSATSSYKKALQNPNLPENWQRRCGDSSPVSKPLTTMCVACAIRELRKFPY